MPDHLNYAAARALIRPAFTAGAAVTITGVAASGGVVTVTNSGSNGLTAGDVVLIEAIVGAVEANGSWIVATVADATHFTLEGLATVTAYTSGGTAKKLTITGGVLYKAKPFQLEQLLQVLENLGWDRGSGQTAPVQSTFGTIISNTTL